MNKLFKAFLYIAFTMSIVIGNNTIAFAYDYQNIEVSMIYVEEKVFNEDGLLIFEESGFIDDIISNNQLRAVETKRFYRSTSLPEGTIITSTSEIAYTTSANGDRMSQLIDGSEDIYSDIKPLTRKKIETNGTTAIYHASNDIETTFSIIYTGYYDGYKVQHTWIVYPYINIIDF